MKKKLLLIIIFIVALIGLILYYTYAIDVSMDKTTGAVDLVLNVDIKNPSNRTVTVPAGKTKILDMVISNSNGVSINYGIAYSGTKPSNVRIAQLDISKDPVSGSIANNATKYVTIVIENKSSTNYTYTLLPISGYQNGGSLVVPSGYTLISDIYYTLPANANDYIMSLSQGNSWESGASGIYAASSYDDNGVTKYHDYRYVGANVHNFVSFNNDLYQIIGVFDDNSHGVTGEWLVKLIMADTLIGASWGTTNSSPEYTTYSTYESNWETTNVNILLNEFF